MGGLGLLLGFGSKLLDKLIPNPEERDKAKVEMMRLAQKGEFKEQENKVKVITAEAQGNWLQRSWRPLLMMLFGVIIANNYIIAPYLGAMFDAQVMLEIPQNMWGLLKLGIGGYIGGRSLEKVAKEAPNILKAFKSNRSWGE